MMGPEKLSTIRKHVRKSFKMTDAQLLAWFDRQMQGCKRKTQNTHTELETLRLLRDALLQETGGEKTPRRRTRTSVKNR